MERFAEVRIHMLLVLKPLHALGETADLAFAKWKALYPYMYRIVKVPNGELYLFLVPVTVGTNIFASFVISNHFVLCQNF